jgi:predicted nuclease with TOPRIM domain
MEYLILLVVGALGFGFYQLKKRNEAEVDSKLDETKGKDSILVRDQVKIQNEINSIDQRLQEITEERKKQLAEADTLSLADRAKAAKNRFGK